VPEKSAVLPVASLPTEPAALNANASQPQLTALLHRLDAALGLDGQLL
jgi:hypothetical protein